MVDAMTQKYGRSGQAMETMIGGPGGGKAVRAGKAAYHSIEDMIANGDMGTGTQREAIQAAKNIVPLQNVWYFGTAFNAVAEALKRDKND